VPDIRSSALTEEPNDDELLARCRAAEPGSPERTAACEMLVRRYEGLVRGCVRPYLSSPESADDLMQVGYVGLLKAINSYDPAFGNGLRAYAVPCVSGEIKRHFRDRRWQVRVTRPVQELLLEMRGAAEDLTHELGRHPDEAELAERLGVPVGELREALHAGQAFSAWSLDAPLPGRDDYAPFGETIGEEDGGLDRTVNMESLTTHWDELPRREQRILVLRFYGNLTQEEIARRLGISQMHVSRLLARALRRLRERLLDGTVPG
jgi:RNA polymerase sigma-B factor